MRSFVVALLAAYAISGNGYPYPGTNASVRGIIASITDHCVTIVQSSHTTIAIDDELALANGMAQDLSVGRSVVAYGYWSSGTFYATSIAGT